MHITLFGTCRLNKIKNHNNLNNLVNYTHSTKEVIQLINFLHLFSFKTLQYFIIKLKIL